MPELYGVSDYSYRLHRAQQQEGEEEARMRRPPRWGPGGGDLHLRCNAMVLSIAPLILFCAIS